MKFSTKISISKSDFPIDYNSKIVSLGSCFAVNIGEKFKCFEFQIATNPFGIIFNPVSIEKLFSKSINSEFFTEKDLFFHNERWHCFDVHSDLSNSNKEDFLDDLNQLLQSTKQQLHEATHVIITYGTSWIYRNLETNTIVANCHKVPQKKFIKEILSVETIENSIKNTINLIQKINPNCTIIFTVSPVRHLKDGFVENQRSKAHLITALHNVVTLSLSKCNYFPSYEIMMDELRDYRFYASDMLHLNQVAIDYIWQRFSESNISPESHSIMEEVETIQKSLTHKPFNPNSDEYKKFLGNLNQKINVLALKFPHINLKN